MHVGQEIIIPLVYATILAILLNPLVNFLIGKKVNKILSIAMAVALAIVAVAGAIYIVSSQLSMFSEAYPQLKEKFTTTIAELVQWVSGKLNIRQSKINAWITATQSDAINNFAIGESLTEVGRMLVMGMLLPVYLFMILF